MVSLLSVALGLFVVSISTALVALLWYLGSWKVALGTVGALLFQAAHIGAFIFVDWGEVWRATLLVVHPVGTLTGGALGATMWWLFYEEDREDVFRVDSRGEAIGHKSVPRSRFENAYVVGGEEIPTRRQDGTNRRVWLVKEWLFREDAPDIFVVPWEKNIDPDEAFSHYGKVQEVHGDLEDDSKLVDRLKLSVRKLCRRSYKAGVYDAGQATDSHLDMGDMVFWDEMEEHVEEVEKADLDKYRDEPKKEDDTDEPSAEEVAEHAVDILKNGGGDGGD